MTEILISSDSHVIEDPTLWRRELPAELRDRAPESRDWIAAFQKAGGGAEGGSDPSLRLVEMSQDGVSGEVLYPTLALDLFSLADPQLQAACFRVYNDWLLSYCSVAPDRLVGVALLPAYVIEDAAAELRRCHGLGMPGAMVWQRPPDGLEFSTDHYDPLWAVAEELEMPISLHILTGQGYPFPVGSTLHELARQAIATKLYNAENALSDLITSGVCERFPSLKFVFVENEVSWLPFVLSQLDKYAARNAWETPMTKSPSEYFESNVYFTFFNDPPARSTFSRFPHNLMWSNDYPHPNSTWPNSRAVIDRDLGHLDGTVRHNLVAGNVASLYGLADVLSVTQQ